MTAEEYNALKPNDVRHMRASPLTAKLRNLRQLRDSNVTGNEVPGFGDFVSVDSGTYGRWVTRLLCAAGAA